MRINLTKKDIVNSIYMKLGFSKKILDVILDDILNIIVENLKVNKKVKISNNETKNSLAKKILKQEHKLYPRAILKVFSL